MFSFAKTYEPPLEAYARTPCTYETTTIASSPEIAKEIGSTRWRAASELATRTPSAASVAYATEEVGSDEKIGSARNFGSSVSESSRVARGRPIANLFAAVETASRR